MPAQLLESLLMLRICLLLLCTATALSVSPSRSQSAIGRSFTEMVGPFSSKFVPMEPPIAAGPKALREAGNSSTVNWNSNGAMAGETLWCGLKSVYRKWGYAPGHQGQARPDHETAAYRRP